MTARQKSTASAPRSRSAMTARIEGPGRSHRSKRSVASAPATTAAASVRPPRRTRNLRARNEAARSRARNGAGRRRLGDPPRLRRVHGASSGSILRRGSRTGATARIGASQSSWRCCETTATRPSVNAEGTSATCSRSNTRPPPAAAIAVEHRAVLARARALAVVERDREVCRRGLRIGLRRVGRPHAHVVERRSLGLERRLEQVLALGRPAGARSAPAAPSGPRRGRSAPAARRADRPSGVNLAWTPRASPAS